MFGAIVLAFVGWEIAFIQIIIESCRSESGIIG